MTPPVFESFASSESYKHIEFYKVDVDAVPDVAREVAVRAVCCRPQLGQLQLQRTKMQSLIARSASFVKCERS